MADPNPSSPNFAPVKNEVEASQGVKTGHVRWVLVLSMILIVIGMVVAFAIA